MEVEFAQWSARCEACRREAVTRAQGPGTQRDTMDSREDGKGESGGEMEVAQDMCQDQAMEGLQDCFEVKREVPTSSTTGGEPDGAAGEALPGGLVSDMIELLDFFGTTQVMPNHDRLGTLRLMSQKAKKMEATFDLLAKALRRKRQATVNRKKRRGGGWTPMRRSEIGRRSQWPNPKEGDRVPAPMKKGRPAMASRLAQTEKSQ